MINKILILKISIILLSVILLYIFVGIFYDSAGRQVLVFTIVPVVLTALFFGLWPGMIMETFLLLFGIFFTSIISRIHILELLKFDIRNNLFGILTHYILVALLGYMRDQQKTIKKLNKEIIRISKIDELTNLYNRRALLEAAHREFAKTIRNLSDISSFVKLNKRKRSATNTSQNNINFKKKRNVEDYFNVFTCALFDIDFFKKVNDNYGHLMGDRVLQKIGNILKADNNLRECDIYGRYGGEEFLIIFPGTSARNSIYAVQRITEKIKAEKFITREGNTFSITISTGISQFDKGDKEYNDIIYRADKALYYAKHHGRDQTIVFEEQFKDRSSLVKNCTPDGENQFYFIR